LDRPPESVEEDEPFDTPGLHRFVLDQSVLYSEEPDAQLLQLQRQGQLALSGFGQLQQDQMRGLRTKVRGHLSPWLSMPGQDMPAQLLQLKAHGIDLALRWGGDTRIWRQLSNNEALQLDLRPGKVLNKAGQARLSTLASLWLGHLSANAAGVATTSLQSGEDGVVGLAPLNAESAQSLLADLVAIYLQAWHQPLPLACQTACAWLMATHFPSSHLKSDDEVQDKAYAAALQAFAGGYNRPGEWSASTCLQRAFPEFEDLWSELPVWAERVYGPMLQALIPCEKRSSNDAVAPHKVDA
jgi:exodeoxyribonuclease V gamma subunit